MSARRCRLRVVEREARVFARLWRGSVFSSFVTPVLYLGAMGVGLGGIVDARNRSVDGLSYLAFVTPGLMAAGAVTSASGESLWPILAGFKWMRHYEAMSAAPCRGRPTSTTVSSPGSGCHVALTSQRLPGRGRRCSAACSRPGRRWPCPPPCSARSPSSRRSRRSRPPRRTTPRSRRSCGLRCFRCSCSPARSSRSSLLPDWAQWLVVFSPLWHARRALPGRDHRARQLGGPGARRRAVRLRRGRRWWGHRTFTRRLSP